MSEDTNIDWDREARTGVAEAVFAESKTDTQLADIANQAVARSHSMLFTRMLPSQYDFVSSHCSAELDYDPISRTLILNAHSLQASSVNRSVGVVAAGTSDVPVASEVQRCLAFFGIPHDLYTDVGVAGLWRLTQVQAELEKHTLLIAVAGMEGALFSVLAGLVSAPLIAVPSSVGYGVAAGGTVALHSALASCSPGIVTVNIDNGFGAASAAKKILLSTQQKPDSG